MEGGNSERLSVILTALGIEGEVTGVSGGNELLSVSENAGEWVVTSHKSLFRIFTKEKKGSKIREKEKR